MFKTIRRSYWLITEFFRRHSVLIVRTVAVVLIGSFILVITSRVLPTPRPIHRIGTVGKFTLETLPLSVQTKVSSGLVSIDSSGTAQPSLASGWEIKDDGREYIFTLNSGLTWHDGTSLSASDINYNFKEVEVHSEGNQIIFRLEEPFTPFMYAVSRPILKEGKYGVGEYKIDDSVVFAGVVQSVTLVSDNNIIIYKFYPTESAALTAFQLGEIDQIEALSRVPENISSESTYLFSQNSSLPKITVLFLNNNDALLQSKTIRQALAYAIKNKSFGFERALSPISSSSWAYNPLVKEYNYDNARAKSLFGQDVTDPGSTQLELKTTLQYLDIAEKIAADWREALGVAVTVKVVTSITSDYQILLADYAPPADPDQYTTWHSTQPGNFTHYTNLRVDKLLEDGRRTADPKLRREIYFDFQRFLLEDLPAIFLFETVSYDLSRKPLFE